MEALKICTYKMHAFPELVAALFNRPLNIDFDKPGGHYQRASVVRPEARELRASPSLVDRGPKMSLIITTPKPSPFPQECWQAHPWVHKHPPLDRQLPGFHPKSVHAGKG